MVEVVLLTGGNLGEVERTLALARTALQREIGVECATSSLWRSEAHGFESSDRFLNQVLIFRTPLTAEEVLSRCLRIEQQLGRVRDPQATGYTSRLIDIDILFYGEQIFDLPHLQIPHPRLWERLFVLFPLAEACPSWRHPTLHQSSQTLLETLLRNTPAEEPLPRQHTTST